MTLLGHISITHSHGSVMATTLVNGKA